MIRRSRHSPAAFFLPLFVGLFLTLSFVFGPVLAATTDTISFQSKLVNADGTNIANNTYNFRFRMYNASSGGTLLWSEDRSLAVADGVLSVELGTVTAFSTVPTLFDNADIYLQVCFDANGNTGDSSDTNCDSVAHRYEEIFATRKSITAVPLAFRAKALTDSAGNSFGPNSFFKQGGNAFTATAVLGTTDAYGLQFKTNNTVAMTILSTGDVGIGTPTPGAKLDISASGATSRYGVISTVSIDDLGNYAEGQWAGYFHATGAGTLNDSYGIMAISDTTNNGGDSVGVYGSGGTAGVVGVSAANGIGIYGSSLGSGRAGQFFINSATGYAIHASQLDASGYNVYATGGVNYFSGNTGIGLVPNANKLSVGGTFGIIETGTSPTYFTIFQGGDQAADITYTLPTASANGVLTNTSGVLSWVVGGGSGDITDVGSMISGAVFADATADDDWLGLGASAGRIEFDDQATDEVNILAANVGIGTSTPGQKLSVAGTLGIIETGTAPTYYTVFQGGDQTADITYTLPVNAGSSGYVLRTDGSGALSWASSGSLYSASNTVSSGSYLTVAHNQATNDLLSNAWYYDAHASQWRTIDNAGSKTIKHALQNEWDDAATSGKIRVNTSLTGVELAPSVNTGTGADGAITISSSKSINSGASSISGRTCTDIGGTGGDAPYYSVSALSSNTATLTTSPSNPGCLKAGDEVLLINLQGTAGYVANVGNYETLIVSSISTNTVTFTTAKTKYYGNGGTDDTNLGIAATSQKVMLQRVPNYTNVTVDGSINFYPDAYNYSTGLGGVMFFRATGTVTVTGTIHANGKGYAGGVATSSITTARPMPGQSLWYSTGTEGAGGFTTTTQADRDGVAGTYSGGGGGGEYLTNTPGSGGTGSSTVGAGGGGAGGHGGRYNASVSGNGGGGGGGGYGTAGTGGVGDTNGSAGTGSASGAGGAGNGAVAVNNAGGGGGGAANYGASTLENLFFGSGGGAGGSGQVGTTAAVTSGTYGGAGGGIVQISADTVTVSGAVQSGGSMATVPGSSIGACGGGGSGGSIRLEGTTVTLGTSLVTATGAVAQTSTCVNDGGAGGDGRIAVYYGASSSGTSSPAASATSVAYNNYGLYHSAPISTTNAVAFEDIRWEGNLNTYGKLQVQTRSGNSTDPTDGTWEAWKPSTATTNYLYLHASDTHTLWTGTNATVSEGDVTRNIDMFEDEDEGTVGNVTKVVSSTNGGYIAADIESGPEDLSGYSYITFWVRASQPGNTLTIGFGESVATEQELNVTIDATDTWQKVYWDISGITGASRDKVLKLRVTNLTTASNTFYIDNIEAEQLGATLTGTQITSTPNNYLQYRVIFTTRNTSYPPMLENVYVSYNNGYKVVQADNNTVRLYNYSGETQDLRLSVGAATGNGGTSSITVGSMTGSSVFADSSADDDWLGLGASAGRIEFDDQAVDEINFLSAYVGIGTSTPSNPLDIVGSTDLASLRITNYNVSSNPIFQLYGPASTNVSTGKAFAIFTSGESYARSQFYTDGKFGIGPGSSTRDIFLSRSDTNTLLISSDGSTGTGNLIVTGNVGIGTSTVPTSFLLQVAGHIGPNANDTYDLGSSAARFKDLYLGGDTLHIGTSTTDEGTISYDTTNNILEIDTDSTTGGDIAFGTNQIYIDSSLNIVGFGTTTPTSGRHLTVAGAGAQYIEIRRTADLVNTAVLGGMEFTGVDPEAGDVAASLILSRAGSAWVSGSAESDLVFYVTPNGSTTRGITFVMEGSGRFLMYTSPTTVGTTALCWDNSGSSYINDCNGSATDIAEYYKSTPNVEPGDVVSHDANTYLLVKKTEGANDMNVAGIISTNPSGPLGDVMGEGTIEDADNPVPLALVGRVPTKVNLESGNIAIGDLLTLSSVAGVAKKYTGTGIIIGRALEAYDGTKQLSEGVQYIHQTLDDKVRDGYRSELDSEMMTQAEIDVIVAPKIAEIMPPLPPEGVGKIMVNVGIDRTAVLNAVDTGSSYWTGVSDTAITTPYSITAGGVTSTVGEFNVLRARTMSVNDLLLVDDVGNLTTSGKITSGSIATSVITGVDGLVNVALTGSDVFKVAADAQSMLEVSVQGVKVNNLVVTDQQAGRAVIKVGESQITVNSTLVNSQSVIVVTPNKAVSVAVVPGSGEFIVKLSEAASTDIEVGWYVVNVE